MWNNLQMRRMALAVVVGVHLLPVWSFRYFPSQDGPAHVYNAYVMSHYHEPEHAVFRQYYAFRKEPLPNYMGHVILAGLMRGLPPLLAEKLFLSLYVATFVGALYYAAGAVTRNPAAAVCLGLPFVYNYPVHSGLYNFGCSLVLYLVILGYVLRHYPVFRVRQLLVLSAVLLLCYFAHLLSLAMALIGVALIAAGQLAVTVWNARRETAYTSPAEWRTHAKAWGRLALAAFPAVLLSLRFLGPRHGTMQWASLSDLLYGFWRLYSLVCYDRLEIYLSTLLFWSFNAVVCLLLARKIAQGRLTPPDILLPAVAVAWFIYFLGPDAMSGGSNISPRFLLYPYLLTILWVVAQEPWPALARPFVIGAVALSLALMAVRWPRYTEINDYLSEYLSGAESIEAHATVLPLVYSRRGETPDGRPLSIRIAPFIQASGYLCTERDAIDLSNYEAKYMDYFPLKFRESFDPAEHIGLTYISWDGAPPDVSFSDYGKATGGNVEYVLVWSLRERHRRHPYTRRVLRQLATHYRPIFTSRPRGELKVYQRKEAPFASP